MTETMPATFGTLLRHFRLAARLSQEALAERAQLSVEAISALERGTRLAPHQDSVDLLARALNLSEADRARLAAAVPRRRAPRSSTGLLYRAALPPLPAPLTRFIGRQADLAATLALFESGRARLLTLAGAGGVGKTRLAIAIAAALAPRFHGAVALVPLAGVADQALVAPSVALALGVQGEPERPVLDTLTFALRITPLLLILDSCEHLLDSCARLADHLLQRCPALCILATSRQALGIGGETTWPVSPLPVPPLDDALTPEALLSYDAVQLFLDRAQAVRPTFAVTPANAEAIAQITRALDGLPLAIELAAARTHGLTAPQLAARLDQRFQLLTAGSRAAPPHQRTLQATVDWSYHLLSPQEQALFDRLAVFAGGFALEAAEAVGVSDTTAAGDVLGLLLSLVEQSLVEAEESADGTTRYRLLDTLRQYAHERLRERRAEEASDRHAAYYLALVEEAEPRLLGADQVPWFDRLEREQDNLRSAMRWLRERGDAERGPRLAGALWQYWGIRGNRSEGREWLAAFLTLPAASAPTLPRARGLFAAGYLTYLQFALPDALGYLQECLAIARAQVDPVLAARALGVVGWVHHRAGEYAAARQAAEESLRLFRQRDDSWGVALALDALGLVVQAEGQEQAAWELARDAVRLARQVGDRWRIVNALHQLLGLLASSRGERSQSLELAEEELREAQELGYTVGIAMAHQSLAELALDEGNYAAASAGYERFREAGQRVGARVGVILGLIGLGRVERDLGDRQLARAHFEQALGLSQTGALPHQAARLLCLLGDLARADGDGARARQLLAEALRLGRELGSSGAIAHALALLAQLALAEGQPARAARLLGTTDTLGSAARVFPGVPKDYDRAAATLNEALAGPCYLAWRQVGQAMSLEQAVAYALEVSGDG